LDFDLYLLIGILTGPFPWKWMKETPVHALLGWTGSLTANRSLPTMCAICVCGHGIVCLMLGLYVVYL